MIEHLFSLFTLALTALVSITWPDACYHIEREHFEGCYYTNICVWRYQTPPIVCADLWKRGTCTW